MGCNLGPASPRQRQCALTTWVVGLTFRVGGRKLSCQGPHVRGRIDRHKEVDRCATVTSLVGELEPHTAYLLPWANLKDRRLTVARHRTHRPAPDRSSVHA